jgi:4-carboxymuconolactone decarboxylase
MDPQRNTSPATRKGLAMASTSLLLAASSLAHATLPSPVDVQAVSPALQAYTQEVLFADLWQRPGLSQRDRSIVTLAVLVARNQPGELPQYLHHALDSGVTPAEVSELITHLAFYAGWGNAMAAVAVAKDVFAQRHIGADQLPLAMVDLLPLDQASESKRAEAVQQNAGATAPGVVHFTGEVLFKNLWLRPGLAPRDRSLVTISALIAAGQVAQVPYHLNRAMDNGLTQPQASEALTQLAFYAGWPNVFSAIPVAKGVFEQRAAAASAN